MDTTVMVPTETQQSISQWATETFGLASSDARVLVRAIEEFVEALRCFSAGDEGPKCREEIADTWIVLCRLAERLEVDLAFSSWIFPPSWPHARCAARILGELSDTLQWLTASDFEKFFTTPPAGLNAGAMLRALADRMDFDLQAEVDRKMSINRGRRWNITADGHGYHVREKSTP